MIAVGTEAPAFAATAVASGRRFSLADWRGQPVLLLFVDYRTSGLVADVTRAIRERYPQHTDVLVVTVADMQVVPRLMRGVATGMMESAYRQAAPQIPPGYDPADHLILLPDWDGAICRPYGAAELGRLPALVLVDGNGRVTATYQGMEPAQAGLAALASGRERGQ